MCYLVGLFSVRRGWGGVLKGCLCCVVLCFAFPVLCNEVGVSGAVG